jgi:uncharacterized protein YkwD
MYGMKKSTWVCALIVAYCLAASVVMYRSLQPVPVTATPQVAAASTFRFRIHPDSPDPNQVFMRANQIRLQNGAYPLQANPKLAALADARAQDIAQRQYYAHRDPDGHLYYDLFDQYGIKTDYSCENLDLAFTPDPEVALSDWLASSKGHRECLTNPTLTQAGYAAIKMTLLEHDGHNIPAYVVVAIQSTDVR